MANCKIEYDVINERNRTAQNAVGPTTSMTLRTLSNASPTDSNSIFLAKNGNDANSGTLAAPVLTLERAINLMQASAGAKITCHIIRNGYVGDLTFVATDLHEPGDDIPNGSIFQVELGEVATITFSNDWGDPEPGDGALNLKFNGLYLLANSLTSGRLYLEGSTTHINWCESSMFISFSSVNVDAELNNSIFYRSGNSANSIPNLGDVTNCIFINTIVSFRSSPRVVNHCTFVYNEDSALSFGTLTGNTVKNCIFFGNDIDAEKTTGSATFSYNLFIKNSIPNGFTDGGNNLIGINPLFVDYSNNDFRLQAKNISLGGGKYYPYESPAIGAGDDSKDLGAYDFTYAYLAETKSTYTFPLDIEFDVVSETDEFVNEQAYTGVLGGSNLTFDSLNQEYRFELGSEHWTGNEESGKIAKVIKSDIHPKRFYPSYPDTQDAIFEANITSGSSDPYEITLDTLNDGQHLDLYLGWVAEIIWNSGSNSTWVRLDSYTDEDPIMVTYLRGDVLTTSETGTLYIRYFPCHFIGGLSRESKFFNQTYSPFARGAETSLGTTDFDFHVVSFGLKQMREQPL